MIFTGQRVQRLLRGFVAAAALAVLAACGGGEQAEAFDPKRLFAFGDDMSVLQGPQGRKVMVNAVGTDGAIDCSANTSSQPSLLWTQRLADLFSFVFRECNPADLTVSAYTYAQPGAKAADFVAQVAKARLESGGFTQDDLMTVLIGANDVLELIELYVADPTNDTATRLYNDLRARATRLGNEINELTANCGPKFIVSTIPWMQYTPYGLRLASEHPDIGVLQQLNDFTNAFNSALRTTLVNDGRRWGLVELDSMVQAGVDNPSGYGLDNITATTCLAGASECRNLPAELTPGANPTTWLWATERWVGWRAQQYMGNYARTRANNNPFGRCTAATSGS
jgi:lysophospholipase L1-like esterase